MNKKFISIFLACMVFTQIYCSGNINQLDKNNLIQLYTEFDEWNHETILRSKNEQYNNNQSLPRWRICEHKYLNLQDKPTLVSKIYGSHKSSKYYSKFLTMTFGDIFFKNVPNMYADSPAYMEREQGLNYRESAEIIMAHSIYCLENIDKLIQLKKNKKPRETY